MGLDRREPERIDMPRLKRATIDSAQEHKRQATVSREDKLSFGKKRLGDILIAAGVLDEERLSAALALQKTSGERLGEALINSGQVSEIDIISALASQLDIRVFHASGAGAVESDTTLLIPEHMARKYQALAVGRAGTVLTVAMVDPLDMVAIDDIRVATGMDIDLQVGRYDEIDKAISMAYTNANAGQDLADAIEVAKLELGSGPGSGQTASEQELRNKAEDAPIVRFVDLIMGQAIAQRATDVHIEPLKDRVVVRYRVDGVLYDAITPPRQFSEAIVVRIKILSNMDVAERRIPLDGRFTVRIDGREVDVRVSTIPTVHGEKIAMRLLDKSVFTGSIEGLGFESDTLDMFRKGLRKPYGMVLISGPTGSGKTTSLYGGLSELDRTSKNITTLEDPVEYYLDRVNQVPINVKAGMTFANGLRAFLRQDPDIIMIGEMRDLETAELGVRAALTGHLVLSTVHANDAPSSLTRLVDIGIEPYLVTSSVHMVMAQRLVRKLCQECKEEYVPEAHVLESVRNGELDGVTFYRGKGCKHCNGRGYRGRVGVYELMTSSPEIVRLVLEKKSADEIKRVAISQGMRSLRSGALMKVRQGVTTIEEALSIIAETA